MGKNKGNPYRTRQAQDLLAAAEEAFEDAGKLVFDDPEAAQDHLSESIEKIRQYGGVVNTAREKDGLSPLSDTQLVTHFQRKTTIDDFSNMQTKIKEGLTGERDMRKLIPRR